MGLEKLLDDCKSVLLSPSQHQALTKTTYDTDEDKLFAFWQGYFSHFWGSLELTMRQDLECLGWLLQPIIYQFDLYNYIYKHKSIDAYVKSLRNKYPLNNIRFNNNGKIYAVFAVKDRNISISYYGRYCKEIGQSLSSFGLPPHMSIIAYPLEIRLPFVELPLNENIINRYKYFVWLDQWETMWNAIGNDLSKNRDLYFAALDKKRIDDKKSKEPKLIL